MNNEEKILNMLEKVDARLSKLEQGQAKMQEDIESIKEDVQVTRGATNALVEWVEQAEVQVRIPFMKKAE